MEIPSSVSFISKYKFPLLNEMKKAASPHTPSEKMRLLETELHTKFGAMVFVLNWLTIALKKGGIRIVRLNRVGIEFMLCVRKESLVYLS